MSRSGSVQVDEQPHARLLHAAGAAVQEETASAKARHFGRLDTELKLLLEQSAETYSIVTVLSVDPDAHRKQVTKSSTKATATCCFPSFYSKLKDLGHSWLAQPLEMWRSMRRTLTRRA